MKRLILPLGFACLLFYATARDANGQLVSIPNMTVPNTEIDFDTFPAGPITAGGIIAGYPGVNLNSITATTRGGTGIYNFQTAGGNGLAARDAAGNLGIIPPPLGVFQNTNSIDLGFIIPVNQFGFRIGDWDGPFNVLAFSGASQVGALQVSTTGSPVHYIQLTGGVFDSVRLTALPDNSSANWVLNGLFIENYTPSPSPSRRRVRVTPTLFITDTPAILSVMYSALPMGHIHQSVVLDAINAATRGVNETEFRARAGENRSTGHRWDNGGSTLAGNTSSLLRHLAFVQDENMSYKVAIGLADPEERTLEVDMVDTLSARGGADFDGQPLSGGLPYAMMGVPLVPVAGGAATVHIVEAAPSGKAVIDDSKAVVEAEEWKRWELYAAGDFSFYNQDQLTDLMQGFDTDTYAGSVGVEYRALPWLNVGLAWSYLQSDTHISGNLGNIDLEGNVLSGYATAFWRQYWADLMYSYGAFDSDLRRNTGLGSSARGNTDSQSHNIRLNFGRNFNIGHGFVTGPIAGLRYSNGDIDPYSETGGSRAAVDYDGTDFESMVSRLGWQATHIKSTNWGRLVSQIHLAWEHEYMPENGTVNASLQTSPFALVTGNNVRRVGGFSAGDEGAHPGSDWLSAGVGLRFELANGVAVLTDYEGVFFRNNASQHYASAKLSYEWGSFLPREKATQRGSKNTVADFEPMPEQSMAPQMATTVETDAPAPSPTAGTRKSVGGLIGWLQERNHRPAATAPAQ